MATVKVFIGKWSRAAQLGEGKIYGSWEFVRRWIAGIGSKFNAAHVSGHAVGELG